MSYKFLRDLLQEKKRRWVRKEGPEETPIWGVGCADPPAVVKAAS
jgi:hypothetical protein